MASYSVSPAGVLVRTRSDIYEGCSAALISRLYLVTERVHWSGNSSISIL